MVNMNTETEILSETELLTISCLARRLDRARLTVARRVESGELVADFELAPHSVPLFRADRIAEIKSLLNRSEILA